MRDLRVVFSHRLVNFYHWLIRVIGREWLEYLISNTMNLGLHRLTSFFWTYDCKAMIVDIIQETPTTKTFMLLPNQHFSAALPGQHTELSVRIGDEISKRCYTLSMVSDDLVAITVKQQTNGKVSNWLHNNAEPGMQLTISPPRGRFIYEGQDRLVLICAGSGITPCFALINQFDESRPSPHISLYYRSKYAADVIFRNHLQENALINQLELSYSENSPNSNGEVEAELQLLFPELLKSAVYLCGPAGFRDRVINYLQANGYDMNQLYMENFAPLTGTGNQSQQSPSQQTWQGDVVVHLSSQNQSFLMKAADQGKTLLESAEANGIKMVHGCRSGMCGTCKTRIISGEISGARLGNTIYPCVAYPASAEVVLQ